MSEKGAQYLLVDNGPRERRLSLIDIGDRMFEVSAQPIAVDSPNSFVDDAPTATLIRQVLGAVAEFDKAMTRDERLVAGGWTRAHASVSGCSKTAE